MAEGSDAETKPSWKFTLARYLGLKAAFQPLDDEQEAIANVASEYMPPSELSRYLSLMTPRVEEGQSRILAGMRASTVEVICDAPRVRAIRLGNGATLGAKMVAGDTIYERDFYPQLVRDMRTADLDVLLLGNSGVGTSMFQYYLLARYANPALFQDMGSAPPTRRILFGSAAPPKVVIRQVRGFFHVLFLEKGVAHRVTSQEVLDSFDPATTLYFFERGLLENDEPIGLTHELSTLATMPPILTRSKYFQRDATTMYCPAYTLEELLAIGRDMRQPARGFPSELGDLYSDANITQRFEGFNGIFRHVLPASAKAAAEHLRHRNTYLAYAPESELIDSPISLITERVEASKFALMYQVERRANGELNFCSECLYYAGPRVLAVVREAYRTKSFEEVQRWLRYWGDPDKEDRFYAIQPELFEEAVARLLTDGRGVRWELRRVGAPTPWASQALEGRLHVFEGEGEGEGEGEFPTYAEMAVDTLYRPLKPTFAFCDLMYKDGSTGALVCVQVSWTKEHTVEKGALGTFCHAVGLCADKDGRRFTDAEAQNVRDTLQLVVCPRPHVSGDFTLSFAEGCVLTGGAVATMGDGYSSGI